ncbi:MAG: hypothetical protein GF364_16360 [Candidatus Lokiarchaeota archaeon]|nr:hypothetical protein [Candidatus Lokiarchaeota archaeon]
MGWLEELLQEGLFPKFGDFTELLRAVGSLLGVGIFLFVVIVAFVIPLLGLVKYKIKIKPSWLLFSIVLMIVCGPTYGFTYFGIIY